MTSRERVQRAIHFGSPDRVPFFHGVLPAAREVLGKALERIFADYPSDFGGAGWAAPADCDVVHASYRLGTHTDEWGCVWENLHEGVAGQPRGYPLADWCALRTYRFPDLAHFGDFGKVPETIAANRHLYITGGGYNIFERMQWLRGYANLMMDLATLPREVYKLRDRMVETYLGGVHRWLEFDVDAIGFSDDWGTQRALMIRPQLWREFYKPAYTAMFAPVVKAGKNVHFHSDGYNIEIIEDLMECGVNQINVQMNCMGIEEIGRRFGGRLCFRSDVDRQYILPRGTPQQMRDHVRRICHAVGSARGGLIASGEIGPDVPLANIEAMYEAFLEFGTYA
jgi:hypothetical protein